MALTGKEVAALQATEKLFRKADKDGLYIEVPPKGKKRWRFRYSFEAKPQSLSLGVYPDVSLKQARLKAHDFKVMLINKENPACTRKTSTNINNTFEYIAREYVLNHSLKLTEKSKLDILRRLTNHVFPCIGDKQINDITVHDIIDLLKVMEKQGVLESARRMRQKCSEIFRYAILLRLAEHNPAADLQGIIPVPPKKHYATLTGEKEISALLKAIDTYQGYFLTVLALKIAPFVFVRPDNLCSMEWTELNFEKAEWRIPAEKMKTKVAHIVPLATQVLELLKQAKELSRSTYVFYSLRSPKRRMTPDTLRVALRALGISKEELTTHGFRAMASTLLNEQGYNRDWIERQLAHNEGNQVRASYNHALYLPERRQMMQEWADYLDRLKLL